MLDNSHNTIITGGTFVASNSTEPRTWIDALRSHCALGALLDSEERFDPPRCAPETREAIIKEIVDWVNGGAETASMLWLHGAAGAGKSALAQSTAELFQKTGQHAATFFFSRTSASVERSNGNLLVATLVLQLVIAIPEMRPHVKSAIINDPLLFSRSRRTQMELLFTTPLRLAFAGQPKLDPGPEVPAPKERRPSRIVRVLRWFTRRTKRKAMKSAVPPQMSAPPAPKVLPKVRLVVIDGLDECDDPEVQCDILRIFASALPLLPLPIRFLIASRPESHIVRIFDHNPDFQTRNLVRRVDLGLDADADDNIRVFLLMKFREIRRTHPLREYLDPSWPSEGAIQTLVQKSSTQFIYPSTVMKYVQHYRGRPDERLEIILGLSVAPAKDRPFAQLDALYIFIFSTTDPDDLETIQRIFGILYLSTQKLYSYLERSPASLEEYIGLKSGQVTILLDNFLSLLALPPNQHSIIRIFHASLFDFLLDPSRSGDFSLDLAITHETLTMYQIQYPGRQFSGTVEKGLYYALLHCRHACLSPRLLDLLRDFPSFYAFLGVWCQYPGPSRGIIDSEMFAWVPILVQKFFTLLAQDAADPNGLAAHERKILHHIQRIATMYDQDDLRNEPEESNYPIESRDSFYNILILPLISPQISQALASHSDPLLSFSDLAQNFSDDDDVLISVKGIFIAASWRGRRDPLWLLGLCTIFSWLQAYVISEDEVDLTFRKAVTFCLDIIREGCDLDHEDVQSCLLCWDTFTANPAHNGQLQPIKIQEEEEAEAGGRH